MHTSVEPRRGAVVTGTGSAVPSRLVTNAELSRMVGDDIAPFASGTLGIDQRYWCTGNESTADLAEEAARAALASAGVHANEIDLLIVATDTPEFITPSTASVLHGRLELTNAGAFDVNAGGAGFVTALDVAWKYLQVDTRYTRILVVGVSAMSKYLDVHDPKTVALFADGAGAVVLEASAEPGVLASELFADGRHSHGMGIFAGGTRTPITHTVLDAGLHHRLRVVQPIPSSLYEEQWPLLANAVLSRAGVSATDVALWLWPQMHRATIERVMSNFGLPMERAHLTMQTWGYTGSASLPMALDSAARAGQVADGDVLMLIDAGVGLTMGALALRWRGW